MRSSSIVLSLLVFALLPLQDVNFFISPVEEGRAVCPGEELNYTFNIFDNTSLDPTLVCSVLYSNGSSDELTLAFYNRKKLVKRDQFLLQAANDSVGDYYNFTLTVNASLELNGTVIICSHNSDEVGRATLLVVEADVRVISLNGTRAIATCSGFIGSAYCRVDYGTSPDSLEYSATSQQMGSAGESVTVELTEAGLPNTTYYYEANLSDCDKVKGQFTTGDYNVCTLADLGANASDSSACGGEKAGYISNGTLCYTGLTPGSTATVSCEDGYEPSGGNGQLVCQDDGTWSGPTPTCVKNCRESDLFVGGNDTSPSLCHAGENAVGIPGGSLSCTGLTPGSTATYSCDKGYELNGGNGSLVCQDDGTWSGPTPTCEKSAVWNDGKKAGLIVGVIICFLVIVSLLICVIMYLRCDRSKGCLFLKKHLHHVIGCLPFCLKKHLRCRNRNEVQQHESRHTAELEGVQVQTEDGRSVQPQEGGSQLVCARAEYVHRHVQPGTMHDRDSHDQGTDPLPSSTDSAMKASPRDSNREETSLNTKPQGSDSKVEPSDVVVKPCPVVGDLN